MDKEEFKERFQMSEVDFVLFCIFIITLLITGGMSILALIFGLSGLIW